MNNHTGKIGITTGGCAQAAAYACAVMLSTGKKIDSVEIELPNKMRRAMPLVNQQISQGYACCGVIKDSGEEDNDVTNGIAIVCEIIKQNKSGIFIEGGEGVGTVTRPGLAVKVGEYAINPTPKKMILRDVSSLLSTTKNEGYIVRISIPKGKEIARRTYNPRLGIVDGISIIGTTGVVKPKSQESYKKSLMVELNVATAAGFKTIFIASGYLGERLLTGEYNVSDQQIIKVGDHVGYMLEACLEKGIKKVMVIGHIGKLVKVAAGLFNTHSKTGDARMETIAAYAALNGASQDLVKEILDVTLAEATIDLLKKNNLLCAFDTIAEKATQRCRQLCQGKIEIVSVLLSLKGEVVGAYPENIFKDKEWEKFIS